MFRSLALACGVVFVSLAGDARAQDECTYGEVQALSEVLPVVRQMIDRGVGYPRLIDARACQYRLFFDGAEFYFNAGEPFLGGIVYFFPYVAEGFTREEAVADLEALVDRVWLDGVEQPLDCTAYKDIRSVAFGQIIYRQCSYIGNLAPGVYQSHWESTYYGEFNGEADVTLVIE